MSALTSTFFWRTSLSCILPRQMAACQQHDSEHQALQVGPLREQAAPRAEQGLQGAAQQVLNAWPQRQHGGHFLVVQAELGLNGRVSKPGAGCATVVNQHVLTAASLQQWLQQHMTRVHLIMESLLVLQAVTQACLR